MKKTINSFLFLYIVILLCSFQISFATNNNPYVILISFDGFRWDYLDRGLTPNLDKIINDGVRALSLRPVFPSKTFPNHISIVTGLYPEHHGIILNYIKNPFNGKIYRLGDREAVSDPVWYSGEFIWETAEKQGVTTASFFWPGSELNVKYRRPTYYKKYEHELPYSERVKGVLDWLSLPQDKRPHFITMYFHETDSQGHDFGTNSKEVNEAIQLLDRQIGDLTTGLKTIGLKDSVNIIIVSDHGMTEISAGKLINIKKILKDYDCDLSGNGPVMMVDAQQPEVYNLLKSNAYNFHVYKKSELPDFYHFSKHPFIYPIILIAEPGYSLTDTDDEEKNESLSHGGNHGYEKDFLDMHGIFIADGPAFKTAYRTGTIWNIDIYPLICRILNIMPHEPIDGKLERIGFILKED